MISRLDQIFFFCISTNSINYSVFHGGRWLQPSTVPYPEPAIKNGRFPVRFLEIEVLNHRISSPVHLS